MLRPPEQGIHDMTAASVWARPMAMVEDGLVRHAGLLQGVPQDRHVVPAALFVDGLRHPDHCALLPGEDCGGMRAGRNGLPKMSRARQHWATRSAVRASAC